MKPFLPLALQLRKAFHDAIHVRRIVRLSDAGRKPIHFGGTSYASPRLKYCHTSEGRVTRVPIFSDVGRKLGTRVTRPSEMFLIWGLA